MRQDDQHVFQRGEAVRLIQAQSGAVEVGATGTVLARLSQGGVYTVDFDGVIQRVPHAALEPSEQRRRGPLGEPLTDAELGPIRVRRRLGRWQVEYGSYARGDYAERAGALSAAKRAAIREGRTIEEVDG